VTASLCHEFWSTRIVSSFSSFWASVRRRCATSKELLQYLVPLADSVGADQAVMERVLMTLLISVQGGHETQDGRLGDELAQAHQIEETGCIRILQGEIAPVPHPLHRKKGPWLLRVSETVA